MRFSAVQTVRRWVGLATVAVLCSTGGAAHAARFVASFDPLFNLDFNAEVGANVGWRGTATIDVDDSCLSPGIHWVGGWSSCESASLESGTLDFYNIDSGLDFKNLAWVGGPSEILLLKVDNSLNLAGINIYPSVKFDDVWLFGDKWDISLDFALSGPTLKLTEVCDSKHKYKCHPEVFRSGQDGEASQPKVSWSRVPEPASLVLVAVALAPLAWAGRRRKA